MTKPRFLGRVKPYSGVEIQFLSCFRCKVRQSEQQWSICANGNRQLPICNECDVELNEMVMKFTNFPPKLAEKLLNQYKEKLLAQ